MEAQKRIRVTWGAILRAWLHIKHPGESGERDGRGVREEGRRLGKIERGWEWNQTAGRRKGTKEEGNTVGDSWAWKPTVPHERLKVKLRSATAREFGFPAVTEYSQSYPTLPSASAALTLKYDLILPLRTSSRRGKRFRDVPLLCRRPRPCGCLPPGHRPPSHKRNRPLSTPALATFYLRKITGFPSTRTIPGCNAAVPPALRQR